MMKNESLMKKKQKQSQRKRKKRKNQTEKHLDEKNDYFGLDELFEQLGDELLFTKIDQLLNHDLRKNFEIL